MSENGVATPAENLAESGYINQVKALEVVARTESTRNYFLAQTLESTRTVPVVSAKLPIDTGSPREPASPAEGNSDDGTEGGDDSDESDLVAAATQANSVDRGEVSPASTVVGSFVYRGITYAVEPGGESVVIVAADHAQLPQDFIEAQAIVLPSQVSADGIDYYSVTRIADGAFASFTEALVSDADDVSIVASGDDADIASRFATAGSNGDADGEEVITGTDTVIENADDSIGVTTITIPASITSIEANAFTGFETLQYVIVSSGNPNYSAYDGCLYDKPQTNLLLIPEGRLGAVRVAPSAEAIFEDVSSHCAYVTSLTADPDSAASQLLEANDLYNAKNEPIEVVIEATAPALHATYDATYTIDQGETLELVTTGTSEVSYAFSNDILEATERGLVATKGGTTAVVLRMSAEDDAFIQAATVVVSSVDSAKPVGISEAESAEEPTEADSGSTDVYINESVALYADGADPSDDGKEQPLTSIGDLFSFEFIEGKSDEVSVKAADTDIAGAISIPLSYTIDGKAYKVTEIATGGFEGCTKITSATIPNSVRRINENAFKGCSSLETVSLPSDVDGGLRIDAFIVRDTKVKELFIPACATIIDVKFTNHNSTIQTITVDPNNPKYCSEDGIFLSKDRTILYRCPPSWKKALVKDGVGLTYAVPSSVKKIESSAFHSNVTIKNLQIPDSVTSMGAYSLKGMTLLEDVYIYGYPELDDNVFEWYVGHDPTKVHCPQDAVTAWGKVKNNTLEKYRNRIDIQPIDNTNYFRLVEPDLETKTAAIAATDDETVPLQGAVIIPSEYTEDGITYTVTQIAQNGFEGCTDITSVTIPNSVNWVRQYAFKDCASLETIFFPSDVEGGKLSVSSYIIRGQSSVKDLYFPACATNIDRLFLNFNTSVQTITVDPANPKYCSVDGMLLSKNRATLYRCPPSWRSDSVKDNVGISYSIPSSVKAMNDSAFHYNTTIKELHIPTSVASIGAYSLKGMTLLEDVYVYGSPQLDSEIFETWVGRKTVIHCPQEAISAWEIVKANTNATYRDRIVMEAIDNTSYFRLVDPDSETKTAAIAATDDETVPLKGAIVIPSEYTEGGITYKVTEVAESGFEGCSDITSVIIPDSVNRINDNAFKNCAELETISLPSGVAGGLYLGAFLVRGTKLAEFFIPACVTNIDDRFMNHNATIQTITVDSANSSYCSVEGMLFSKDRATLFRCPPNWRVGSVTKDTGLTYAVPSSVRTIASSAFHYNATIKELHIPDSVTTIGAYGLKGMTALEDVYSYGNPQLDKNLFETWVGHDPTTIHCVRGAEAAWEKIRDNGLTLQPKRIVIDVILEAYTVTFDASGKTYAHMPQNQTISSGSMIAYQEPTCNGYTFQGWYTDAACKNSFAFSTTLKDNAHLYAKWSDPIPYDVSYSGGEPTSGKTTTYTVESSSFSFAAPADKRGYVFKGWKVSLATAGQGNLSVSNNGEIDATVTPGCPDTYGNLTVTAVWGAKSYKMAFDISTFADAAWNPDEDPNGKYDDVEFDKDVTFPEVVPVKIGWRFAYWVRTDDPDGKIYRAGQKVTQANFCSEQDATATFEAHWVENLSVEVPLSSQNVGLEVSADFTANPDTATFDVKKGSAKIVNRSDAALKVVSIVESDDEQLQDRKDAVKDVFDARDNGQDILDAILANGSVKLALAPASQIEDADAAHGDAYEADETKEVEFALFGGSGDMADRGWVIPAPVPAEEGAKAQALRVLYDMRFADDAPMSILDMKINLENKTVSKLIYTMVLADSDTKPKYKVNLPSATS